MEFIDENEYKEMIKMLFNCLDFDKSGIIDLTTIELLFKGLGKPINPVFLNKLTKETLFTGGICFERFYELYSNKVQNFDPKQLLYLAFQTLNPEQNGKITAQSLKNACKSLSICINDEDIEFLINQFGGNKGHISLNDISSLYSM